MKTTNKRILELNESLKVAFTQGDLNFKYLIKKNKVLLSSETESLESIKKTIDDKLVDYNKESMAIYQKYGKEKVVNGQQLLVIDKLDEDGGETQNFINSQLEFAKLNEDNQQLIDDCNAEYKEYSDLLLKEVDLDIKFIDIPKAECPKNITPNELEFLMDFEIIK